LTRERSSGPRRARGSKWRRRSSSGSRSIPLHVEGLRAHGEPVPPPHSKVEYVEAV
jgi:hypothetical protein